MKYFVWITSHGTKRQRKTSGTAPARSGGDPQCGIKVGDIRMPFAFNQLLAIHCWRDAMGELHAAGRKSGASAVPSGARQRFTIILMLTGGGGVADRQYVWRFTSAIVDCTRTGENKWLTREQTSGMQQIRQALSALPLPV